MNYASIDIANEDLVFFGRGARSNYRQLMGEKADEFGGKGFITEYAAPANELMVTHPLLRDLGIRHAYLTRLNTVISPEEMTVDPIFEYDAQLRDVSNIRDLSDMTGLYDCERQAQNASMDSRVVGDAGDGPAVRTLVIGIALGALLMALMGALVWLGIAIGRRYM